jgi:hypothetical protein
MTKPNDPYVVPSRMDAANTQPQQWPDVSTTGSTSAFDELDVWNGGGPSALADDAAYGSLD